MRLPVAILLASILASARVPKRSVNSWAGRTGRSAVAGACRQR